MSEPSSRYRNIYPRDYPVESTKDEVNANVTVSKQLLSEVNMCSQDHSLQSDQHDVKATKSELLSRRISPPIAQVLWAYLHRRHCSVYVREASKCRMAYRKQ